MGQGTSTAASGGDTGGTGIGMQLIGSLFGSGQGAQGSYGMSYAGDATMAPGEYGMSMGQGQAGPDMWSRIGTLLQDPQVQQSLKGVSDTAQHIGKAINSADKIPPPAAQMIQQAISSQGGAQGRISGMGDIPAFSPPQAAALLHSMGISVGGSSDARGGGAGFGLPFGAAPAAPPPMPNNPSEY